MTVCTYGARPKFSFLEENVTIRRASGPMAFVKFIPSLYRCYIRQGPLKIPKSGPYCPQNTPLKNPLITYDKAREARPKICEKLIKCGGAERAQNLRFQ